jgi:hypothetical protein
MGISCRCPRRISSSLQLVQGLKPLFVVELDVAVEAATHKTTQKKRVIAAR